MTRTLFTLSILLFSALFSKEDMKQISEAFGHIISKNIKQIDVDFDLEGIIKGIQDGSLEKKPPMTEKECLQALSAVQEKKLEEQSKNNLEQAELFLARNRKEEDIHVSESGKLQYRIVKKGSGEEIKPHFVPLIRYTIQKLDGFCFGPKEEEPINLDATIPGLQLGLIGMKEGEQRIFYIHPDMAYGDKGALLLPPNLLLVFEIEVLKANTKSS